MLFLQVKLFLFFVVNCLFLAVLGLHCSVGFALVGRERGALFSCGVRASHCVASLVAVPGL